MIVLYGLAIAGCWLHSVIAHCGSCSFVLALVNELLIYEAQVGYRHIFHFGSPVEMFCFPDGTNGESKMDFSGMPMEKSERVRTKVRGQNHEHDEQDEKDWLGIIIIRRVVILRFYLQYIFDRIFLGRQTKLKPLRLRIVNALARALVYWCGFCYPAHTGRVFV